MLERKIVNASVLLIRSTTAHLCEGRERDLDGSGTIDIGLGEDRSLPCEELGLETKSCICVTVYYASYSSLQL